MHRRNQGGSKRNDPARFDVWERPVDPAKDTDDKRPMICFNSMSSSMSVWNRKPSPVLRRLVPDRVRRLFKDGLPIAFVMLTNEFFKVYRTFLM